LLTFSKENIELWTVTSVAEKELSVKHADGTIENIPYGALIWAGEQLFITHLDSLIPTLIFNYRRYRTTQVGSRLDEEDS
jgi:hypothetical protein